MKRKQIFGFGLVSVLATFISIIVISGCGDSSSTSYSYAGAGSYWTITNHNGSTATITKYANTSSTTADFTVNVSIQALTSTGFEKLTVTSVTGSGGPSVGDTAYGFGVDGFIYVLKPLDASDDQLIAMVAGGNCPTSDYNMNWVKVKASGGGADPSTVGNDFFGLAAYTSSNTTMTLNSKYNLASFASQSAGDTMSASCSNGVTEFTGGVLYTTQNGGGIVHTDPGGSNDGIIFGFTASEITVADQAGKWTGLYFNANASSGDQVKPVTVDLTDGGSSLSGTGLEWSDVENGTKAGSGATVTLNSINSPSNGFMTGTIAGSATTNLACTATTSVMSCVGVVPETGAGDKMYNLLLKKCSGCN